MNPVLLAYVATMLACAGLTVGGVFVLLGLGYALIAGGVFTFGIAEIFRRSMTSVG